MKKQKIFFFCPASDYLNQFNETGSHGQISYQFLKHLSFKKEVEKVYAIVIKSLKVESIGKTSIKVLINKQGVLYDFDSLYFYIASFIKYIFNIEYKNAQVVHHFLPFSFGRSFNLFFIFKNRTKKYVLGPIIGPHSDKEYVVDEEYLFFEKKIDILNLAKKIIIINIKNLLFSLFGASLYYLSKLTFQKADIVFFSDQYSLNYHKKFLKDSQKAYILDTGIDTDIFKPLPLKEKDKNEALKVLFVGRLTKRKGCEYLIKAISEAINLNKDIKIQCRIHGVGPLMDSLKDLARKLNIEDNVIFLGGVKSNEEIVKRYQDSDIVCLPALSETFTVTKEALSCGKPVIVTDICSNAERIQDGVNGFVIEPRNSKSIAKILVRIASNKKLLKVLSENAVKSRELYKWDNITNNYLVYIN